MSLHMYPGNEEATEVPTMKLPGFQESSRVSEGCMKVGFHGLLTKLTNPEGVPSQSPIRQIAVVSEGSTQVMVFKVVVWAAVMVTEAV